MRIAFGVEYDGRNFCGWQRQAADRTVQQCVESALSVVANHPIRVFCAGRTDSGVHAYGQVIHADTEATRSPRSWLLGANSNLPDDVNISWARPVEDHFHARFSAQRRRYQYVILNRVARSATMHQRVTWECRPLDCERMHAGAQALLGTHDFSAYRAQHCQAKSPIRTLFSLQLSRRDDLIILEVEADGFLQHMVRNIAGVLIAVGLARASVDWPQQVLEGRDRTRGGVTAPPEGLYLTEVTYPAEFNLPAPAKASY